ncbi:MAG: hypothetical protein OXT65_05690, partial [Alphaproteobacteria bacterium]|nr:hypothetical protein [Alphaproteobacteria bacterium]
RHKEKILPVKAAEEGRFIIYLPDFADGKGPVLLPNIKEMEAKMRGSDGEVKSIELEAGPQCIPADGTNVIVINRVDPFVQMALSAKLTHLIDSANGEFTRDVLDKFMSYARGYSYDPDTQTITFARNVGFRNDVYNMSVKEFKARYMRHGRPDLSLEKVKDHNIRSGYYIKKPLEGCALYLQGKFSVQLPVVSGGAMQEFQHGAMVNLPDDPSLPISFIHVSDINTCYTKQNGWQIVDSDGQHRLPIFGVDDVLQPQAPSARKGFPQGPK